MPPEGAGHRAAIEAVLWEKHDTGVGAVAARAAGGERLSGAELTALFEGVASAAHVLRFKFNPAEVVTYIVDRNINDTNVCVYRKPGDADAYVLPFDVIAKKVEETIAAGGTGNLLQGGVHPGLRLPFYEGLLRHLKASFPVVHLHEFSVPEIHFIAKAERMPLPEVIARLRDAGLESIRGGGAEVLEGKTRKRIWLRAKASTSQWLDVNHEAHRLGMRTAATMMFGVGEPSSARVEHLLRMRERQDETGGFTPRQRRTLYEPL